MIDEAAFKAAMSHFASGVTVVTTEHEGERFGMTVASFASLSLHPPLVLICIERSVRSHDAIAASRKFGVNILSDGQADVSNVFATKSGDRFEGLKTLRGSMTGVPLIEGALTSLECELREHLPGGDHSIFVGEVVAASPGEGVPLIYYRSGYHSLRV